MPDHSLAFVACGLRGSPALSSGLDISISIDLLDTSSSDAFSAVLVSSTFTSDSCVDDLAIRNRNIARCLLEIQGTDVREGSVQHLLTILERPHGALRLDAKLLLTLMLQRLFLG